MSIFKKKVKGDKWGLKYRVYDGIGLVGSEDPIPNLTETDGYEKHGTNEVGEYDEYLEIWNTPEEIEERRKDLAPLMKLAWKGVPWEPSKKVDKETKEPDRKIKIVIKKEAVA